MDGGKNYGQGTFGTVYGNPAPLCENDKTINNYDVGKVFLMDDDETNDAEKYAKKEYKIAEDLQKTMTTQDFKKMKSKYAILPKRICKIDQEEMQNLPNIYNEKWRETKTGKENDEIDNAETMVLYDKAEIDMHDNIEQIKNFSDFEKECKNIKNVFEAIELLHQYDIGHFDIKTNNIVLHNGQYKLIDFGKYKKMENIDSDYAYHIAFFSYPSSTLYLKNPNNIQIGKIFSQSNTKSYLSIHHFLYKPFAITTENYETLGFTNAQQMKMTDYCRELYRQKYLGFMGFYEEAAATNNNSKNKTMDEYKTFIKQQKEQNTLLLNNDNIDEKTLYKKVDIYALGIVLLSTINQFIQNITETAAATTTTKTSKTSKTSKIKQKSNKTRKNNKRKSSKNKTIFNAEQCQKIMHIYEVAFQCCNYINQSNKDKLQFVEIKSIIKMLKSKQ